MNRLIPKVESQGNVTVLTFSGNVVREIENRLSAQLGDRASRPGKCHLLLDFTNIERISSEELGTLIGLHKKIRAVGGQLTLFNLSSSIYEVFAVCHLQSFLNICRHQSVPLPPSNPPTFPRETSGDEWPSRPSEPWTSETRLRDLGRLHKRLGERIGAMFRALESDSISRMREQALQFMHGQMLDLEREWEGIEEALRIG